MCFGSWNAAEIASCDLDNLLHILHGVGFDFLMLQEFCRPTSHVLAFHGQLRGIHRFGDYCVARGDSGPSIRPAAIAFHSKWARLLLAEKYILGIVMLDIALSTGFMRVVSAHAQHDLSDLE